MTINLSFPCNKEQFERLRAAFAEQGIIVDDNSQGVLVQDGVTCEYADDGETLSIVVKDIPFWEAPFAKGKIADFINAAIA